MVRTIVNKPEKNPGTQKKVIALKEATREKKPTKIKNLLEDLDVTPHKASSSTDLIARVAAACMEHKDMLFFVRGFMHPDIQLAEDVEKKGGLQENAVGQELNYEDEEQQKYVLFISAKHLGNSSPVFFSECDWPELRFRIKALDHRARIKNVSVSGTKEVVSGWITYLKKFYKFLCKEFGGYGVPFDTFMQYSTPSFDGGISTVEDTCAAFAMSDEKVSVNLAVISFLDRLVGKCKKLKELQVARVNEISKGSRGARAASAASGVGVKGEGNRKRTATGLCGGVGGHWMRTASRRSDIVRNAAALRRPMGLENFQLIPPRKKVVGKMRAECPLRDLHRRVAGCTRMRAEHGRPSLRRRAVKKEEVIIPRRILLAKRRPAES